MDNNRPPSDSNDLIRKTHQQASKASDDAEQGLRGLSASPARSTWSSPVATPRSTSTAYSHTASNATAMDFSTRTGISPNSFSPASDGMRTAVDHTPARRRRSLSRGSVLTQETRSRPSLRRSDIVANIQRHHIEDGIETARSVSPMTAYSPGGLSANTALPISSAPRSNFLTPIPLPDGGVLSPATGLWRTGITPEGRTPGRSFQSRKSSRATKTAVTPSAGSTKTALGTSGGVARAPATPGARPKSTITAILPGTPGSRFERGSLSQKSAKSTKTALGKSQVGTPGGVVAKTPLATPRSTVTAIPPGTPRNLSQRSVKSIKSTKTALGTPGARSNNPRSPGGPASEKSTKSGKTALLPTPKSVFAGRTPNNTPASDVTSGHSQKSAKSTKAVTPRSQASGKSVPVCRTPRPLESKSSLRKTPSQNKSVRSTNTAITPNGASAVTPRSPATRMNTAWTPGTQITLTSSLSPETRTARQLSAPSTPYKGFKATRSGPRSSSVSESTTSSVKSTRTAKSTKSADRPREASSGRNYQNLPDSPLVIVETTSFSRTPTRSAASVTNTAVAPASANSTKSSKKCARSPATAITPGGLSARTARPISEMTPKSSRKSTITAITPGYATPTTARTHFTPRTAKPNTEASTRSGKKQKSEASKKTPRSFVASVNNLRSAMKSAQNSKKSTVSAKSVQSSSGSDIDQQILNEAKKNQHKIVMTSALPDGSFKVVVQVSVRAAGSSRAGVAGNEPEKMVPKKISVNGSEIYEA